MKIFGYGTFITKKMYESKNWVRSAFLPGYIRILRTNDPFPFILKKDPTIINDRDGFWGLVFKISDPEIDVFDYYEGEGYLYDRISIKYVLPDGTGGSAYTYYPTQDTIDSLDLKKYVSSPDSWRMKIQNEYPEIIGRFPELKRTDDPRNN
jgi:hypothetical protein